MKRIFNKIAGIWFFVSSSVLMAQAGSEEEALGHYNSLLKTAFFSGSHGRLTPEAWSMFDLSEASITQIHVAYQDKPLMSWAQQLAKVFFCKKDLVHFEIQSGSQLRFAGNMYIIDTILGANRLLVDAIGEERSRQIWEEYGFGENPNHMAALTPAENLFDQPNELATDLEVRELQRLFALGDEDRNANFMAAFQRRLQPASDEITEKWQYMATKRLAVLIKRKYWPEEAQVSLSEMSAKFETMALEVASELHITDDNERKFFKNVILNYTPTFIIDWFPKFGLQ